MDLRKLVLWVALLVVSGCGGSPLANAVTVANGVEASVHIAEPVIQRMCTDTLNKLPEGSPEALARIEQCDVVDTVYKGVIAAHLALSLTLNAIQAATDDASRSQLMAKIAGQVLALIEAATHFGEAVDAWTRH